MISTALEVVEEDREVYRPHDPSHPSKVVGYKNTKQIELLHNIVEKLTMEKKDYICFRLLGFQEVKAQIMADTLRGKNHHPWAEDNELKGIEDRVMYMQSLYAQQAMTLLDNNTKALAMAVIQQILLRASQWKYARAEDKKMAAMVLKMALDYRPPVVKEAKVEEKDQKGNYEKLILERRTGND